MSCTISTVGGVKLVGTTIDLTADYVVTNLQNSRYNTLSSLTFTKPPAYNTMTNYSYNITATDNTTGNVVYNQQIQPYLLMSPSFSEFKTFFNVDGSGYVYGMAITSPGPNRLAIFARDASCGGVGPLAYSRITNGSWSAISALTHSFDITPPGGPASIYTYRSCSITGNGNRLVIAVGVNNLSNKLYWADSSGLFNETSTSLEFKQITTTFRSIWFLSMMSDGTRFVTSDVSNSVLYIGTWNNDTYVITQFSSPPIKLRATAMSLDGLIITATTNSYPYDLYWSFWNGISYNSLTLSGNINSYSNAISIIGNNMIICIPSNSQSQYSLYNGSTFSVPVNIPSAIIPYATNTYVAMVDLSNVLYTSHYNSANDSSKAINGPAITFQTPPKFTPYNSIVKDISNNFAMGIAVSGSNEMFIYSTFGGTGIAYAFNNNGVFTNIIVPSAGSITYETDPLGTDECYCCCISKDATKLVMSFGSTFANQKLYWADASGILAGKSTTFNFKMVDTTFRSYLWAEMTSTGSRVVTSTITYIYIYNWGGSDYGTNAAVKTLDNNSRTYSSCSISADGNYIVYGAAKTFYWAAWDGTNYSAGTQIDGSCNGTEVRSMEFVNNMIVFVNLSALSQYSIWNGVKYTKLQDISSGSFPITTTGRGLKLDPLVKNRLWSAPYTDINLYNFGFTYNSFPEFSYSRNGITINANTLSMGITKPGPMRLAVFGKELTNFSYSRIINDSWSVITSPSTYNYDVIPPAKFPNYVCTISQTNNRMILSCGAYATSLLYWADASGLYAGTSTTISLKQIDSTARKYSSGALTNNGDRIVVTVYGGVIYFSNWSGSNYGTLNPTLDTTTRFYRCIDVTPIGDRIICGASNLMWSTWNGNNYSQNITAPGTISGNEMGSCIFVGKNSDVVLVTSDLSNAQVCTWEVANYSTFTTLLVNNYVRSSRASGLYSDASYNIYYAPYSYTTLYITSCVYTPYFFDNYVINGLTSTSTYNYKIDVSYNANIYSSPTSITTG